MQNIFFLPAFWIAGYILGKVGLSHLALFPATLWPDMATGWLSCFIVATVVSDKFDSPYSISNPKDLKFKVWEILSWTCLTCASIFLSKNIILTAIVYVAALIKYFTRNKEFCLVLLATVPFMGFAAHRGVHISSVVAAIFLTNSFNKTQQPQQAQQAHPQLQALLELGSVLIPGVSQYALADLFDVKLTSKLDIVIEWGSVFTLLLFGKADGKTLVGSLVDASHISSSPILVWATVFVALFLSTLLKKEGKGEKEEEEEGGRGATAFFFLKKAVTAVAVIAFSKNPVFSVVLAALIIFLNKKGGGNVHLWLIPAFVLGSAIK